MSPNITQDKATRAAGGSSRREAMMKTRKKRSPANRRKAGGDGHPIVELGKDTRFQPGQSGNPLGRPKWKILSDAYRAKLAELVPGDKLGRNFAEAIADAAFAAALEGQIGAIQEIADRTEGKSAQAISVSGEVQLTVAEIDVRLEELLKSASSRESEIVQ